MRLVEHETVGTRQDLAESLVLECQIGAEEMMIDDHQVRGLGLAACRQQMTSLPLGAILSETVVAGRGHDWPDSVILWDRQLGDVTALGRLGPVLDLLERALRFAIQGGDIRERQLQTVSTQIIGASLEQRRADWDPQGTAHQRQVAMEELILEVARSGGDQHLAPREDGGNQIREGLASARAGLADQDATARHERGDACGHRLLLRPRGESGETSGEAAIGSKDVIELGHARVAPCRDRCAH